MRCTGNETDLLDCLHDPNTHDCSHFEDAGVRCRVGGERLIVGAHAYTHSHLFSVKRIFLKILQP